MNALGFPENVTISGGTAESQLRRRHQGGPERFADEDLARVRHAGATFLGRAAPEAIGDYVGGPNHVLPTGRSARYASGLSVFDFLKRTTWISSTGVTDPAAQRTEAITVLSAFLKSQPGLRQNSQGLGAVASAAGKTTPVMELPMEKIP